MRITANQVTMARIFLIPVPSVMLIYGNAVDWWIAFAIFVILGATDFVDGLMARKEGPTKLGSLLDPVADKIFIAAIILSMIALEIFPAWVASALLTRELLVTALRSSVAERQEQIKTSKLAKLKTIIQMGGLGTIFLTIVLPTMWCVVANLALSLPFLLVAIIFRAKQGKQPFWALPVFAAFFMVAGLAYYVSKETSLMVQMTVIIAITWLSAIDYLVGCYRIYRRSGIKGGDWARIMWSISHGVLVAPLVASYPVMVMPILVSMSLEFGLGGIDNIVATEKKTFALMPFLLSSLNAICFSFFINYLVLSGNNIGSPLYASIALGLMSAIICGAYFGRHVTLFKGTLS